MRRKDSRTVFEVNILKSGLHKIGEASARVSETYPSPEAMVMVTLDLETDRHSAGGQTIFKATRLYRM